MGPMQQVALEHIGKCVLSVCDGILHVKEKRMLKN